MTFPWAVCTLVLKSAKNTTIVSTVQKGRVGFPEEVFDRVFDKTVKY